MRRVARGRSSRSRSRARDRDVRAADPAQQAAAPAAAPKSPERALLDQYCVTCHNQRTKTANITFDTLDLAQLSDHADVWEKAVRKLRGGMMPPPGVRRPDQAAVDGLVSWLERSLDQAAAANPNPGRVALHRLNRAEYAECDRGPARAAHRRQRLPAAGRRSRRLRQRRQRAEGVAVVSRSVHLGRAHRQHAGDWESVTEAGQRHLPSAARHRPERARRRSAARHSRRTAGRASVSGRRRVQVEHRRSRHRRLRARHGVPPHARRDDRRRQGLRGADRRRGRHEGHRPAAGAGGRRHQRPFPEHPDQGHGGAAQDRRHLHRPVVRGVRRGAVLVQAGRRRGADSEGGERGGRRPVQSRRPQRDAEPRADFRLPSRRKRTATRTARARRRSSRRSRAGRSAGRSPTAISRRRSASTRRRERRPISTPPSGTG